MEKGGPWPALFALQCWHGCYSENVGNMNLQTVPIHELLRAYREAGQELSRRDLAIHSNAPLADYASQLLSRAFGWKRANGTRSRHLMVAPDGNRYWIKARFPSRGLTLNFAAQPDAVPFDYLAVILFHDDFSLHRAALIPATIVAKEGRYKERKRQLQFSIRGDVWSLACVQDITTDLKRAEDQIQSTTRGEFPAPVKRVQSIDRSREMDWLRAHRNEYAGQWVALHGSELIASSLSGREVFRIAKEKGIQDPFVSHVDSAEGGFFGGW